MIFCFVYDRTSKPAIILSISGNTEKLEYTERKKESRFCCFSLSLHFVLDLQSASLRTADAFPVVASLPPEMRLLFAG